MLFNSVPFLIFAGAFFPVYFLLRGRGRLLFTLAASYFFYAWWHWRFVGLLLFSTALDYAIGIAIDGALEPRRRRALLTLSIVANLTFLGAFKYFNFFADSLAAAAATFGISLSWPVLHIILPIGISFYTFQSLSYTIDVYRRVLPAERSLLHYATFVALFPQLIAGPIVRAERLLPQLRVDAPFDWDRVRSGVELIAWGYFLKLVLADTIAQQIDSNTWFALPGPRGGLSAAVGAVFFAFQIYGDFAGYSLIAIGLARIMGFDFGVNFVRPYFSTSFSEFWRRWHISLSSWLRDYLYIPLGGNRHGPAKTTRNLVLTMLLGGLWHGAAWTFVVWGLLHGFYLAVERFLRGPRRSTAASATRAGALAQIALVFTLTTLAWIFFRSPTFANAWEMITDIVLWRSGEISLTSDRLTLGKCVLAILIVLSVDALAERPSIRTAYQASSLLRGVGLLFTLWGIAFLGTFAGATFIYFRF